MEIRQRRLKNAAGGVPRCSQTGAEPEPPEGPVSPQIAGRVSQSVLRYRTQEWPVLACSRHRGRCWAETTPRELLTQCVVITEFQGTWQVLESLQVPSGTVSLSPVFIRSSYKSQVLCFLCALYYFKS
uniref:Uncharacterized protein n=1 Tax=Molossus molossus TaxID=27622 RepID=A0A7J8I1L3_MOLMO|nr:hypothetical protein HJG59_010900 [Molossus molossus]